MLKADALASTQVGTPYYLLISPDACYCCLLLATHYSLLTTHYSLLTTYYSLLTYLPLATQVGTPYYVAPELWRNRPYASMARVP